MDRVQLADTSPWKGMPDMSDTDSTYSMNTRTARPTALGDLRLAITGAGLLVVLYALPGGFGQLFISVRDRYLRWVANRRDIIVPSLVADKRGGVENSVGMLEGALTDEVNEDAALEVLGGEELVEAVHEHEHEVVASRG